MDSPPDVYRTVSDPTDSPPSCVSSTRPSSRTFIPTDTWGASAVVFGRPRSANHSGVDTDVPLRSWIAYASRPDPSDVVTEADSRAISPSGVIWTTPLAVSMLSASGVVPVIRYVTTGSPSTVVAFSRVVDRSPSTPSSPAPPPVARSKVTSFVCTSSSGTTSLYWVPLRKYSFASRSQPSLVPTYSSFSASNRSSIRLDWFSPASRITRR